ncbi:hypothetical protein DRO97_00595 [Archaeoglobales archaeon]|nr:MAG: hypothetical protein DRO97_00595 [Archaeoglobales archaeon]
MTYIFVEVRFGEYSSKGKTKDVQSGTRQVLLGLDNPKLPEKVNKQLGWPAIKPLFFALIKEPKKYYVGGKPRVRNLAAGAIACYYYTWSDDKLEKTIEILNNVLLKIKEGSKWLKWETFRIYLAKEIHQKTL